MDPIRPQDKAAIAECRSAGIRAVMITGDHRDTAVAIAKELGIDRALVTCDKNNPASAKTILRCGGVLEDERLENGELVQRYWITI